MPAFHEAEHLAGHPAHGKSFAIELAGEGIEGRHDIGDGAVVVKFGMRCRGLLSLEPGIESGARVGEDKTCSARRIRGHRNGPMPRLTVER